MTDEVRKARTAQIVFFVAGAVLLASVYFGWSWFVAVPALLVGATLAAIMQLGMRCRSCGVSYFFDPTISSWNVTGVNFLKPAAKRCLKCGAER
jgi:hypothetical protein